MHQIRELDRILDEEHRHIVGHQIPVALIGVELDGKPAHVPGGILGAPLPGDGRKAHKYRRLLALLGKGRRAGQVLEAVKALEKTMGTRAAGMHDPLGNPLMVEVGNLFPENEVLEQSRPAKPRLERGLVIGNQYALVGGQRPLGRRCPILIQRAVLIPAIRHRARPAGLGTAVHFARRTRRRQIIKHRRHRPRRRRTGATILTGLGVVMRHAASHLAHHLRLLYRRPLRTCRC